MMRVQVVSPGGNSTSMAMRVRMAMFRSSPAASNDADRTGLSYSKAVSGGAGKVPSRAGQPLRPSDWTQNRVPDASRRRSSTRLESRFSVDHSIHRCLAFARSSACNAMTCSTMRRSALACGAASRKTSRIGGSLHGRVRCPLAGDQTGRDPRCTEVGFGGPRLAGGVIAQT